MDITWRVFSGDEEGRNSGGKVQGIRSIIGRHKIDRERPKMIQETENSKNICTTHQHDLSGENAGGLGGTG